MLDMYVRDTRLRKLTSHSPSLRRHHIHQKERWSMHPRSRGNPSHPRSIQELVSINWMYITGLTRESQPCCMLLCEHIMSEMSWRPVFLRTLSPTSHQPEHQGCGHIVSYVNGINMDKWENKSETYGLWVRLFSIRGSDPIVALWRFESTNVLVERSCSAL